MFYENMLGIVKRGKYDHHNKFTEEHLMFINGIVHNKWRIQQSYIVIYLFPFLSLPLENVISQRIFTKIAKHITFLIVPAKNIIRKRYYQYFLEYFKMSKRKRKFVRKMHYKYG